jgi:taurine dioxygenase
MTEQTAGTTPSGSVSSADGVNDPRGIRAEPMGGPLGARIHGVDLSQPLSEAAFDRVLELFHRHQVVFFRDQRITPQQLVAFSARFGELDVHHMTEHVFPDLPWVRVLSNAKRDGRTVGITRGGMHWHSDLSYKPQTALATLLYGLECPPEGADTQFTSMSAAWLALPESMRRRLVGLRAVHDRNFRYAQLYPNRPPLTAEQVAKVPPSEHPLVVRHPATGEPALFVARDVVSHLVGVDAAEGRALIDELEAFATRPGQVYSHRWQAGDVLVWDNRCTLHRATPFAFDEYTRTMYRTQVRGAAPEAAWPEAA